MRDDGDEPGRILISHSDDGGYSWTYAQKSDIPNPGASVEVIKLNSGNWVLVYNDVDDGRIHVTYSYHLPGNRKSIKHIAFEEKWILDYLK